MSRAFVKEDDAGQAPLIPPRAALPPNTPNYVTPAGLEALRQELLDLEQQRSRVEQQRDNEADRTRQLTILKGRLAALTERLGSAKPIEPDLESPAEVRFGTTVTLETVAGGKPGQRRKFTLVGVDEADLKEHKIAFVAPIAQAVLGKKQGEQAELRLGARTEILVVKHISYGQ